MTINFKKILVKQEFYGRRLDNFIISTIKVPKTLIYRCIRKKIIKVNNKKVTSPSYKLKERDEISIPNFYINTKIININISKKILDLLNSRIIHENNNYLIINKPAKIAVHGGTNISYSLIDIIKILKKDLNYLELGHRLDKDTSGTMLFAKNYKFLTVFHELLRKNELKKVYHAIIYGNLTKNNIKIDLPIIKVKDKTKKVCVDYKYGKNSITFIKTIKRFNKFSLIEAIPKSGRKHQIRVHLSHIGHPIVFDKTYNNIKFKKLEKYCLTSSRILLHSYKLSFLEKIEDQVLKRCFKSEYDIDFNQFLNFIRKNNL